MYFEPPKIVELPTDTIEIRHVISNPALSLAAKTIVMPSPSPSSYDRTPMPEVVKSMPSSFTAMPMVFMKLPQGRWMYQRLEYSSPNGYNIPLTLKSNPKVELGFSSPGVYLIENSHFKSVIKSEPRMVSRAELDSMSIQSFFTEARVEVLNGKNVLAMSGRRDDSDVYELKFLHNPDDSNIWVTAEIIYSAPPAEYKRHIGEVKKALQTIRWAKQITYEP